MTESQERLRAAMRFIRLMGANRVQLRCQDAEYPLIWIVVAIFDGKNSRKIDGVKAEASTDQTKAAWRLAEHLVDGTKCDRCHKHVVLVNEGFTAIPDESFLCLYRYDPELKGIRRGCEYDGISSRS